MSDPRPPAARQRILPVWYGIGFGTWLRLLAMRPPIDASGIGHIAGITVASAANSLLHGIEQLCYGRRVERVGLSEPPVFILGHWRSGTTLLHNLLARDPQFAAPTHYQVSFPGHFLISDAWLSKRTAALLPTRRPMDEMELAWNLPGEDEIALLLTTLQSPYLRAVFPSGGLAVDRLDDLRRNLSPAELEYWKTAFLRFLKKVTLKAPKPLLLKSPAHTGRIPILLELFPEARFIYIVRNPYDVFASTRHLYRTLAEINSLTRRPPEDINERVLSVYRRLYDAYHLHRALIPNTRRYELRYEELVMDPLNALEQLYGYLRLGDFEPMRQTHDADLVRHRSFQKNVYQLDDLSRQAVYERWKPAFTRYGYLP